MNNQKTIKDLLNHFKKAPPLSFEKYTRIDDNLLIEPWTSIRALESCGEPVARFTAILINGAITNNKTTFLFSQRICNKMLKDYPLEGMKGFSGESYKKLLAQLTDEETGFMKCITPPSEFGSKTRKAGTYEITYPGVLEFIKK